MLLNHAFRAGRYTSLYFSPQLSLAAVSRVLKPSNAKALQCPEIALLTQSSYARYLDSFLLTIDSVTVPSWLDTHSKDVALHREPVEKGTIEERLVPVTNAD